MASQIRITKTPELEEVLYFLKQYYKGMTENEIIKKAIVDDYRSKTPFEMFPAEEMTPDLKKGVEEALQEVESGDVSGPFHSAEDFILSLQK